MSRPITRLLGHWPCPAILLCCLGASQPDLLLGHQPRILKMIEFVEKSSVCEQPPDFRSNLFNSLEGYRIRVNVKLLGQKSCLLQSCLDVLNGPNFLCCFLLKLSKETQVYLPHSWIITGWGGFWTVGLCFVVSYGKKILVFLLGQYIWSRNQSLAKF